MDSIGEQQQIELPRFNIITTSVIKQLPKPDSEQPIELQDTASSLNLANKPEVEKFEKDLHYFFCCVGMMVGFGNVLRFPYVVSSNGGAVFLIPYFISIFLVGFPVLVLETAWGQLIETRLNKKFSILHPGLWGLGLAMCWLNIIILPYYTVLFPYNLYFLFNSFQAPLPWKKETALESLWNKDYFPEEVLHRTSDISQPGELVISLTLLMVLTYVILYFTMWKGIQTTSQVALWTVTVPYFIMAVILMKGLTLKGSEDGLRFLFVPDWSKLFEIQIWRAALLQVIYSTNISFGLLMYYASARESRAKIIWTSLGMQLIDATTCLFGSVTIFCFIGHVANELEVDIASISSGGWNLAFTAYPGLITILDMPNLWAVLFFGMMLLLGIDSIFGYYDYVIAYGWDFFYRLRRKIKKEVYVLIIIGSLMICGLQFVTTNGWWWFNIFNDYAVGDCVLFVMAVEVLAIAVYFGIEKLEALMYSRTGETFPTGFAICVQFVTIPMVVALLIYGIRQEVQKPPSTPAWTQWFGRALALVPFLIIALGFVFPLRSSKVEALIKKQYRLEVGTLVEALREKKIIK